MILQLFPMLHTFANNDMLMLITVVVRAFATTALYAEMGGFSCIFFYFF